jgi:hypothetical protein
MARFSERMVTEVVQVFWAAMARGEFITDAAAQAGTYRVKGARWLRAEGGVPRPGFQRNPGSGVHRDRAFGPTDCCAAVGDSAYLSH